MLHGLVVEMSDDDAASTDISSLVASEDSSLIRAAATSEDPDASVARSIGEVLCNRGIDQLAVMCRAYAQQHARLPHEDLARIAARASKEMRLFYSACALCLPEAAGFLPSLPQSQRVLRLHAALEKCGLAKSEYSKKESPSKVTRTRTRTQISAEASTPGQLSAEAGLDVLDVLRSATNADILALKDAYERRYGVALEKLICPQDAESTGVQALLACYLRASRDESDGYDKAALPRDAAQLNAALGRTEPPLGLGLIDSTTEHDLPQLSPLDYGKVATLLVLRSTQHVRRLCRHYLIKYGRSPQEILSSHLVDTSSQAFLKGCMRILPSDAYVWGVLPRTHSRVLRLIDSRDVGGTVKALLRLHGGRRLDEVLLLAQKRLGYPLQIWAERHVAELSPALRYLLHETFEAELDRWWERPADTHPTEDAHELEAALFARAKSGQTAAEHMQDVARLLLKRSDDHLAMCAEEYFRKHDRTLHEDVKDRLGNSIAAKAFGAAVIALLPPETEVEPLPYTAEAREIEQALSQVRRGRLTV
jgi:hypothetical protein